VGGNDLNKYQYVLEHCKADYDEVNGYITTEGITGNFAGRSFYCYDIDEGIKQIISYFDAEFTHQYSNDQTSMVQDVLKEIHWDAMNY
jgi:hypothetical protein